MEAIRSPPKSVLSLPLAWGVFDQIKFGFLHSEVEPTGFLYSSAVGFWYLIHVTLSRKKATVHLLRRHNWSDKYPVSFLIALTTPKKLFSVDFSRDYFIPTRQLFYLEDFKPTKNMTDVLGLTSPENRFLRITLVQVKTDAFLRR